MEADWCGYPLHLRFGIFANLLRRLERARHSGGAWFGLGFNKFVVDPFFDWFLCVYESSDARSGHGFVTAKA